MRRLHTMPRRRKYTLYLLLVLFVFGILLSAVFVVGVFFFLLTYLGAIPEYALRKTPHLVVALLLASMAVGTAMTAFLGKRPLRPFQRFIDATQRIAAGDFSVRVSMDGPEELRRLADSFNAMAKELSGIETLRSDFVSNVSHEFKTPVASIRGFAKLLKKDSLPEERRREYLDIIIRESERLSTLSGNVLLLSKLENLDSVGETAAFSLDEQLRRVILVLEPEWMKKGIALDLDLPPATLVGNGELLQQVWMNLLGNAIKFSSPGGRIEISLSDGEESVTVRIADQGVGMDEETQKHLFDKFFQGDKSHATEGNGLGLSLVGRIVDLSGGTVEISSELGKGSAFQVTLPKG